MRNEASTQSVAAHVKWATKVIVLAQLLGTSLWFSTNGVATQLTEDWGIDTGGIGLLTSAVQIGFIVSTIALAMFGLADRFKASTIFAVSAVLGALANAAVVLVADSLAQGVFFRLLVGIALGGIYPIGMKLIVSWAPEQAGPALAWLVAMLTLGTASPHLIRGLASGWSSTAIVLTSSVAALIAGGLIYRLGTGPHAAAPARSTKILSVFKIRDFRASAFGYFGHMWELYAFWTITPILVAKLLQDLDAETSSRVSLGTFAIIGIGAVGSVLAGRLSRSASSARVAAVALAASGVVSIVYPVLATWTPVVAIIALVVWGMTVIADSAQFSAVCAIAVPREQLGGALALQNAIGFFVTVGSISLLSRFINDWGVWAVWILTPGPILGLWALRSILGTSASPIPIKSSVQEHQ
ncbi:MAG: MFS transporter [Acidimicrobiales bacterium]